MAASFKGEQECAARSIPKSGLFSYYSVEKRIPADHPLRRVKAQADAVLGSMSAQFNAMYASVGRPSVAPERLLKEIFGWMNTPGGFRKNRLVGISKAQLAAYMVGAAYNLLRMARLQANTG